MKKTLAVILSVIMLFSLMPFASFAADSSYDRVKVAANDSAYIDSMSAEQMASVILDWVDRKIAAYAADAKEGIVEGIIADGFEGFEISAFGGVIAAEIPDITSLDDVIAYKGYLSELGGDFATLNATSLVTREEAGSAIGFINGVFQFMADNAETFGKVFRWEEDEAYPGFDFGKVGEYILSLDTSDPDNKKVVDFYNDYLVGNDIQTKFTAWVAKQMNYTIADGESFDDVINNGIINWFAGLCKDNGILSEAATAELLAYNLKTTDIYSLIKSFVALVQSDNQVKLDTYYNYVLDTVVRAMLKTMLGQKATVGAAATVPASFTTTYADLALLKEISGGTVYYQDADKNYYEVTIGEGNALSAKSVTWSSVVDFELPTVSIYSGANFATLVQTYYPTSKDSVKIYSYASAKNQALIPEDMGVTFNGTAVPAEYAALMTEANAKALSNGFGVKVAQGADVISSLDISFADIEAYAEEQALPIAQAAFAQAVASANLPFTVDVTLDAIDVTLGYKGYSTDDEFICDVVVDSVAVTLGGSMASMVQGFADSAAQSAIGTYIDSPVATIVVDGISGDKGFDASAAKDLYDFIDTDFVIDSSFMNFSGNYDAYDGVVGQANHVLVGLVNMLLSDSGEAELNLTDGDNNKLTANLQKICDTANDMMAAAEAIMTDPEIKEVLGDVGLSVDSILAGFDFDLLYKIDFSSVEALWVSVIKLGLDAIDDGENAIIAKVHSLVKDCADLDAMAINVANYAIDECVAKVNASDLGLTLENVAATGSAKNVIMKKLVAIAYDAAAWGVGFANKTANDFLGKLETETGKELPTVAFSLGVTESDDWNVTLAALVDRVYDLADGIILACDNSYTDTFDKISAVANAVLPLGSLASNCAKGDFAVDVNTVMGYIFDDALAGDFDGFLGLFETKVKTNDVAKDVSVTEALIKASDHMVDAFFPNTVEAENYVNNADVVETTCQEYFTSVKVIDKIAANNMGSVNSLKEDLVPAILNLAREAGVLPFFAKCDKDHNSPDLETKKTPGKAATCTEAGREDAYVCAECGYVVSGGKTINALGHDYSGAIKNNGNAENGTHSYLCKNGCGTYGGAETHTWNSGVESPAATCTSDGTKTFTCTVDGCGATYAKTIPAKGHSFTYTVTKAASCTAEGVEIGTCACGETDTRSIAKTAHTDDNKDNECDICGAEISSSFGAKIRAFFQKIINWFKNLFR